MIFGRICTAVTPTTEDNPNTTEAFYYSMLYSQAAVLEAGLQPVDDITFPVVAMRVGNMVTILSVIDFVEMAVDIAESVERVQYAAG